MRMGRDTTCHQHDGANPAERPPLRVKAGLPCASPQHVPQVRPRLGGEPGRASRDAALAQTATVALVFSQSRRPAADRCATDAQLARHSRLGEVAGWSQSTSF
jgi:hypothetical protein